MIRLLGHPIHPMLVHFPLACWMLSIGADFCGRWAGLEAAIETVPWLRAAGCLLALPAMLAGLLEMGTLGNSARVLRTAYLHIGATGGAWLLFAAALLLRWQGPGWSFRPGSAELALSVGGAASLAAGAWFGGELVYRHGVGTSSRCKGS